MIAAQFIEIFGQLEAVQWQQGFCLCRQGRLSAQFHELHLRSCGTTRDTSQVIFQRAIGMVSLDILVQEATTE